MRVLHVIDAGRPRMREFARPRPSQGFDDRVLTCRLVCDLLPHESHVCVLGTRQAAARAASLGLSIGARINPLLGGHRGAARGMGGLVDAIRPDLIHWWGPGLSGGCFGRPGKAWRGEMWTNSTPLALPVWLTAGTALTCGESEERFARSAGLRTVRSESPAFVESQSDARSSPSRDRLLLLGPAGDARTFSYLTGLITVAGQPIEGIMPTETLHRARSRRGRTAEWNVFSVTASPLPRARLLRESALAVWMGGDECPAVAIRSALASGVPVIAPPAAAPFYPEALVNDCVALNETPPEIGRKLVRLAADRAFRDQLGTVARRLIDADEVNRIFVDSVGAAWSTHVGSAWREAESAA